MVTRYGERLPTLRCRNLWNDTFRDLGHKDTASPPTAYKKIRTHLVYDCKHDGRHKARIGADGHLTDIPLESMYSGVVSLQGL
jgi:hypothetical protein